MAENETTELKHKVIDYRRFAFIIIALAGFLMVGAVLPGESAQVLHTGWLLTGVAALLVAAVTLHGVSVKTEQELYAEDNQE